tara:strand:- start:6613 stop:7032 length:420 start_codon:yes stop_codon:yes gene_type:complete
MELVYSKHNIKKASQFVIEKSNTKHYFFKGIVGAGKTTLIKEICKTIKVIDNVNSPTFSIVNEYKTINNKTVFHMDLFRLDNKKDIHDSGLIEYLNEKNIVIIEWPELLLKTFNLSHSLIHIHYINDLKRRITITNNII